MDARLYGVPKYLKVDCFKYLESHVAAELRCERNVVHRMNVGRVQSVVSSEKCAEQLRVGDK